jgi:lipid II:glycine glycyltransferase (peptidoglycan interpeptide bridge formation enzyme)
VTGARWRSSQLTSQEYRGRIVEGPSPSDLSAWDRFAQAVPYSDVTQLTAWVHVREQAGFSPLYLLVEKDGRIVGGAQILRRRVPVLGWIGYSSAGPLIDPHLENAAAPVGLLADALKSTLGRYCRVLFVQPPVGGERTSSALQMRGFRHTKVDIAPRASLRIDLRRSEEELRAGLGRRLRRWTRQWSARGVSIREGDASDLPLLAFLITQSADHHGYQALSLDYLQDLYRNLAPLGAVSLFIGEVDGRPVAAELFTSSGGVLRDRLTGLDRESRAAKLSVRAAIIWHAMLWARERGLQWLDLGGIEEEAAVALMKGQTLEKSDARSQDLFKARFGAEAFVMPPAVAGARPQTALRLLETAQRGQRGRALLAGVGRRLRGGGRSSRAIT